MVRRKLVMFFVGVLLLIASATPGQAQVGPPGAFGPQTVQLPVTATFQAATSVSVPDRGSVVLGGVSSAASGSVQLVPLPVIRSGGGQVGSSVSTARVWIIDAAEMDAALLSNVESRMTHLAPMERMSHARSILQARSGTSRQTSLVSRTATARWKTILQRK